MVGGTKNQFSLTRAALTTCGRAKSNFLSMKKVNAFCTNAINALN